MEGQVKQQAGLLYRELLKVDAVSGRGGRVKKQEKTSIRCVPAVTHNPGLG